MYRNVIVLLWERWQPAVGLGAQPGNAHHEDQHAVGLRRRRGICRDRCSCADRNACAFHAPRRDDRSRVRRARGLRLLAVHPGAAQREGAEEAEREGGEDAEVGVRPGAGLAAEAEGLQQVALPSEPVGGRVGDQAPAEGGGGDGEQKRGRRDVAVAAGFARQLIQVRAGELQPRAAAREQPADDGERRMRRAGRHR